MCCGRAIVDTGCVLCPIEISGQIHFCSTRKIWENGSETIKNLCPLGKYGYNNCIRKYIAYIFGFNIQFVYITVTFSPQPILAKDGAWNTEPQKVVKLGVLPVRSLLIMEETIWAASGGQIFIISTETHTVEVIFFLLQYIFHIVYNTVFL